MMEAIHARQLSIVVQGELSDTAKLALRAYRSRAPEAELVLSTYEHRAQLARSWQAQGMTDKVVLNPDPGPLPPTVKSPTAGDNNLNRMLVTTQAGLAAVNRAFVLKVRSDAVVDPHRVMSRWAAEGENHRLLFASRYTRHPFGINGYLFHVSDWLSFGRTERCRWYWQAPLMDLGNATYFEHVPMPDEGTAIARRFRARLSQEQWVCTHYAKSLGYTVPNRLAERDPYLVQQYIHFLANECIVCDRETLGLELLKHWRSFNSPFQRVDCLSESDWRGFQADRNFSRQTAAGWRRPIFEMRGLISRMLLARKYLALKKAGAHAPCPSAPSQQPPLKSPAFTVYRRPHHQNRTTNRSSSSAQQKGSSSC
jgi:hypothetical protein